MASHPPAPAEDVIKAVLEGPGELTYALNPSPSALDPLVAVLDATDATPAARLLVDAEQLKDEAGDFLFASALANLTARDAVSVRTSDTVQNANLLLRSGTAIQLFDLDVRLAAVETDMPALVDALSTHASTRWESADPFDLRTPPRKAVSETLAAELGQATESDFTAILDSLETARGNGAGLDEVTVALLAAAKNEALLYDISKWGEHVGLASKATFSRTKSTLEELGLIATDKVPIEVGRPRLRLKFADERLRTASPEELASVAMGLLDG